MRTVICIQLFIKTNYIEGNIYTRHDLMTGLQIERADGFK